MASPQPSNPPRRQSRQERPNPVQAIPDQQGALGDVRQCRRRPWQFARSGIGVEVQMGVGVQFVRIVAVSMLNTFNDL